MARAGASGEPTQVGKQGGEADLHRDIYRSLLHPTHGGGLQGVGHYRAGGRGHPHQVGAGAGAGAGARAVHTQGDWSALFL